MRDVQREQANEEARPERLEAQFEKNEQDIAAKQEILVSAWVHYASCLSTSTGNGDTRGVLEGSIVSAELPGRGEWLGEFAASMGKSSKLATIEEIERLWYGFNAK